MAEAAAERYAVVTGANKGIGLEIVKQLASAGIKVVLTSRNENRGLQALETLKASGLSNFVLFHQVDVADATSVASLADFVKSRFGKLDILINNAGIGGVVIEDADLISTVILNRGTVPEDDGTKAVTQTYELAKECLQINYYGAKITTESLMPLLQLSDSPRIVNVSSSLGQLESFPKGSWATEIFSDADNLTEEKVDGILNKFLKDFQEGSFESHGWPRYLGAYIVSKAAMNGYTRILAKKYPSFIINSVCPGYVKTDITSNTGFFTVEEGAASPVRLALLPNGEQCRCRGGIVNGEDVVRKKRGEISDWNLVVRQNYELAEECVETNFFGAEKVTEALLPLLQLSTSPRIVNVSSRGGFLKLIPNEWARRVFSDIENITNEKIHEVLREFLKDYKEGSLESKNWPLALSVYTMSKAALNAYTRMLAKKFPRFRINCLCPDFVKTDITQNIGICSIDEDIECPVRLTLLPDNGPSGLFFLSDEVLSF